MKNKYLKIFSVLSGISLGVYYFIRVYFFIDFSFGFLDGTFAVFLLVAETYMIVHAFGFVLNIFHISGKYKTFQEIKFDANRLPLVAVIVVAKNEPRDVLEQTFVTLKALTYANKNIYFLEGSTDETLVRRDRDLAAKYEITFFNPRKEHGSKAGIINDFLAKMSEDYVAIFDADQNPMPDFLDHVVSIAEGNKKIAFVQTPQFYSNIDVSPIAKGSAMQQSVFYESICEAKGSENAMFCCGTNVLFRRRALLEVGGFDEISITEDFATSIKLHAQGYSSVYYNHVKVFGMAPESLPAYFKQQTRWAAGTTRVLRNLLRLALTHPTKLKLFQWWEYFLSSTYYLIGWAFFLLMICPIAYLLFGIPSYFLSPWVYIPTFIPYFVMTSAVFYATMKNRHYTLSNVYNGIILGSLSFPVLMIATARGLFGGKMSFQTTPKGVVDKLSFLALLPWIIMIVFNLIAVFVGGTHFLTNPYAIGVNMLWCIYHIFILSHIFILNKAPILSEKGTHK